MTGVVGFLSAVCLLIWFVTLLLPWQPWRNREVLETTPADDDFDLNDVTVVIPARNEAEMISATLKALKKQGKGLKVVLVDDNSEDGTAEVAGRSGFEGLSVISGAELPAGWTGKLWAQEQGVRHVATKWTLLLDADIALQPGMLKSLRLKQQAENLDLVSLMAELRFDSFWEKLLMPAFIYFFKMIYPFSLANKPDSFMAAAAGGCILVRTDAVRKIGGMEALKSAVIDDCTLAKKIKKEGFRIWVGLTHGVLSQRPYGELTEIWQMVARTAYTQLRYSIALLMACTFIMLLLYWWPLYALLIEQASIINLLSILLMCILYLPTLRFYRFSPLWSFTLPLISALYLLMTWTSATRYWRGERSRWKGRSYQKI
jgi:hopene-associated glycosyltransferase HpnB